MTKKAQSNLLLTMTIITFMFTNRSKKRTKTQSYTKYGHMQKEPITSLQRPFLKRGKHQSIITLLQDHITLKTASLPILSSKKTSSQPCSRQKQKIYLTKSNAPHLRAKAKEALSAKQKAKTANTATVNSAIT